MLLKMAFLKEMIWILVVKKLIKYKKSKVILQCLNYCKEINAMIK